MKTKCLLAVIVMFLLAVGAGAHVKPVTITFDYDAANIYQSQGTCSTEGDGLDCQTTLNGVTVQTNSDDEFPTAGCTTVHYSSPTYNFPSPAGPYCGAPVSEGVGQATFAVPAGVAVTDPGGNVLGATNAGGTVVIVTQYAGRYIKVQSLHFVKVTFTPGSTPTP